ncbi:MAG: hypothetical protein Lm2023SU_19140 [Serratia ureilytica]
MINKIVDICQDALNTPYQLGKNDCNILVLKVIDLICSTEYVKMCKYDTLRKGRNILKKLGVESTFELIEKYIEEVEFPIPGDIWIDEDDSTVMSVYVSNRILVVDEQHTHFELDFPTDGKFYRVRSSNG